MQTYFGGDSALHEPWHYVSWHLESSAHSSEPSDGTTPSRPWDIWPDQLGGGQVPKLCLWGLTSPPPHSSCAGGLWHLLTHRRPFCFRDEDFYELFQSKPRPALPPRFRSGTSVKPAHKCWLFHTVTTFVPYHTLHLLSESHQVFPFVCRWIGASEAASGYLTMEAAQKHQNIMIRRWYENRIYVRMVCLINDITIIKQ